MTTKTEKALKAVWPQFIPPADYGRAAALVESLLSTVAAPPVRPVTPAPTKAKRPPQQHVSPSALEKIRAVLATGPATASEVTDAVGMNPTTIHFGLKRIATVSGSKRTNGGNKARLWSLKDGTMPATTTSEE